MKLPKDFGRIKMEEEMLRTDAKKRKQQWDREREKSGYQPDKDKILWNILTIIIVLWVAWLVASAVMYFIGQ